MGYIMVYRTLILPIYNRYIHIYIYGMSSNDCMHKSRKDKINTDKQEEYTRYQ